MFVSVYGNEKVYAPLHKYMSNQKNNRHDRKRKKIDSNLGLFAVPATLHAIVPFAPFFAAVFPIFNLGCTTVVVIVACSSVECRKLH